VLTAGSFSPLEKTLRQAVVGGTGVYRQARGLETAIWLDAKFVRARVVFELEG